MINKYRSNIKTICLESLGPLTFEILIFHLLNNFYVLKNIQVRSILFSMVGAVSEIGLTQSV